MQILLRTITAVAFLAIGFWVSVKLFADKEEKSNVAKNSTTDKKPNKGVTSKNTSTTAGIVSRKTRGTETTVLKLIPSDYQVYLQTQGVVRPRTETNLTSTLSGSVKFISPQLQDGAFFKKGDLLLELNSKDYATNIVTAKASLARAEAALAQEQATAAQALRNWQDIGFDEAPNDLVLRKPQLKEANANVAAQQALLDQANRELARTKIYAPFDGRIRENHIGPGETVSTNNPLAEIYATDYAEIRLPLSARQLNQISINEQGNQAIPVQLTDALNAENKTIWKAVVKHVEGELDEVSRELNVIAHIPDPFGTEKQHAPLRMNQPVKASITAKVIKNTHEIDRKHLYGANEILIVEGDIITRKKINIVWSTQNSVITTDQDITGKLLATSRLNFVKSGTTVEIIEEAQHQLAAPKPKKGTETSSNNSK